ncbi:helix-turn-helix transcriptional regulator [Parafrankia colletiae]|uniref:Helix-turn-helix transcriptional regulator n=1 Tax=Parafrankia colletiae TaxID=573497 RepID=A0A1S1QUE6_9ACTN|nr:helix-turn-helix transcriptional regulator [Parafrankia colletiae]MCK9904334.1 helix-turn-helix transcriptional regulator [Frankia sp. Cpl3]OHV36682.1 helix-turn-helix transcriptional regulator [Parafrankia colletiae]
MPAEATKKDLRDILDLVRVLHDDTLNGGGAGGEMPAPVLGRLAAMIGCDSASYCRVDHAERRLLATVVEPASTDLSESAAFAAVLGQHPAFIAHRERRLPTGNSVALTDLMDFRALRNLPIYADFYRPRQTHDQLMNIVTVGRDQGTLLVFNRSRRGFSGRARELLDLVSPLVCQAVAHRERLTRLTTALRDAQRHASASDEAASRLPGLTPREREVAAHLVDGVGDREIARALGVSPRTVHKHLEQIYRKLGLQSRAAVVAMMRQAEPSGQPRRVSSS